MRQRFDYRRDVCPRKTVVPVPALFGDRDHAAAEQPGQVRARRGRAHAGEVRKLARRQWAPVKQGGQNRGAGRISDQGRDRRDVAVMGDVLRFCGHISTLCQTCLGQHQSMAGNPAKAVTDAVEACLALARTWHGWDGRAIARFDEDGVPNTWTPYKALRRIADHLVDHLHEVEALLAGAPPIPDTWHGRMVTLDADWARFTEADYDEACSRLRRLGRMYVLRYEVGGAGSWGRATRSRVDVAPDRRTCRGRHLVRRAGRQTSLDRPASVTWPGWLDAVEFALGPVSRGGASAFLTSADDEAPFLRGLGQAAL